MYRFLILLVIIFDILPAFASRDIVTHYPYKDSYYGAYYGGNYSPRYRRQHNTSRFADLNDLEQYALNRNYLRESDYTRLERLERYAFGAVQQGNLDVRYDNVREAILSRPKPNYKTTILRNISNYFTGQLTGYTPGLAQDNYDSDFDFGKESQSSYISPFRRLYKTDDYGTNTSTGIHILD